MKSETQRANREYSSLFFRYLSQITFHGGLLKLSPYSALKLELTWGLAVFNHGLMSAQSEMAGSP